VLADEPEKYGFNKEPKVPGPVNAWQNVIKPYFPWLIALTGAVSVISFFSTRLLGVGKEKAHEGESIDG
jgi:formate dehydrogenase iron-sulfur subunit